MGTSDSAVVVSDPSRKALPAVKRQHRSPELKLQIVQETLAPGASVARVARAHGVNANQVFTWRRLYRRGLLKSGKIATPGLLAVRVAEPNGTASLTVAEGSQRERSRRMSETRAHSQNDDEARRTSAGMIQAELPKGQLRVTGRVDREALRMVLEALRG